MCVCVIESASKPHGIQSTHLVSMESILRSMLVVEVNVDCGMDTSRIDDEDSMSRHSAIRPRGLGLTSPLGMYILRLPDTCTIWEETKKKRRRAEE